MSETIFDDYLNNPFFKQRTPKTIKDIADQYPSPPKEKIIETVCPCCNKKLRLKVKI